MYQEYFKKSAKVYHLNNIRFYLSQFIVEFLLVGQENWKYERLLIKGNNKLKNYGLCIKMSINISYLSFDILFINRY